MPLVINVGGLRATYKAGHWTTDTPDSEAFMAHLDELMRSADGPGGSDPYPDLTRARRIVKELRGSMIDEGEAPKTKRGVVY